MKNTRKKTKGYNVTEKTFVCSTKFNGDESVVVVHWPKSFLICVLPWRINQRQQTAIANFVAMVGHAAIKKMSGEEVSNHFVVAAKSVGQPSTPSKT